MFETFQNDLTYLPKKKFSIKYTLPFIVAAGCLIVICQLLSLLMPLSQLNKASGKIEDIRFKVDYWKHDRGDLRFNSSYPVYSLFITIDNMQTFNVQNKDYMRKLGAILHQGDQVTIYYPSLGYKLISLGLAHKVSQVESAGKTLYSYDEQRHDVWFVIGLISVFTGMFYILLSGLRKYAI